MPYCSSCGIQIPEGQGSSCSMCYGDINHGSDGYYEQWALEQLAKEEEQKELERQQLEEMEQEQIEQALAESKGE